MKRVVSQVNIDEMQLDESAMELELIKLQANYRHLSDYYDSYKEETQRRIRKQNDSIQELIDERSLLERILGNYSTTEKVVKERNKAELLELLDNIKDSRTELMEELDSLRKDSEEIEAMEEKLLAKRIEMGGIYGPLQHRLTLIKRRAKLEVRQNAMAQEYNKTLAFNAKLRDKIAHVRVERAVFNRLYDKVASELQACKRQKADVLLLASQALEQRQEALTKIQVHKDRDEKEQVVFEQAMKVLERLMCHEKKMNEFMAIKCNDRQDFKTEEAERLEKSIRDTLESDTKTLNQYKESFDCIKEVAELNEVDAIVAKFLSQEAENFALFNYVTELNGEIETLQEEVNVNKREIDKLEQEHTEALNKNEEILAQLKVKRDQLLEEVAKSEHQLTEVTGILSELEKLIWQTFQRIGCPWKDLEEILHLNLEINTKNMIVYLGQIEQRANEMLNILHYVNLKKSQLTGMLPARIDITSFTPKALPELQLSLPTFQDKEPGTKYVFDDEESHPLSGSELREAATESIIARGKELVDRMTRANSAVVKK